MRLPPICAAVLACAAPALAADPAHPTVIELRAATPATEALA